MRSVVCESGCVCVCVRACVCVWARARVCGVCVCVAAAVRVCRAYVCRSTMYHADAGAVGAVARGRAEDRVATAGRGWAVHDDAAAVRSTGRERV